MKFDHVQPIFICRLENDCHKTWTLIIGYLAKSPIQIYVRKMNFRLLVLKAK